jgi:putative acetyltransferase
MNAPQPRPEIRRERPEDFDQVRRVNVEAFGQESEADLVDRLREGGGAVVSLVAVQDGQVVGHILFSPVAFELREGDGDRLPRMAGLAPMAVLPGLQRQGVGSGLIEHGLAACRREGFDAVVVLGHPEYYPRFGFTPAARKGLASEYPVPDEVFMVLELRPGALDGWSGLVKYRPEFSLV